MCLNKLKCLSLSPPERLSNIFSKKEISKPEHTFHKNNKVDFTL